MAEWMGYPLYYAFDGAPPPPRAGAAHATIYPYGPFQAGDGKTVMLGLQNEREWKAVLRQGAAAARAGHRPALCRQRAAQRAPRGAEGADRRGLWRADGRAGGGSAWTKRRSPTPA
jgi:crotonobetainyl-CoA:carnitine CoA-transferase CaiB-like acyl-CoA transferase